MRTTTSLAIIAAVLLSGCVAEPETAVPVEPTSAGGGASRRIGPDDGVTYAVTLPRDVLAVSNASGYEISFQGPGWTAIAFQAEESIELALTVSTPTAPAEGTHHAAAYLYASRTQARNGGTMWTEWWSVPHWDERDVRTVPAKSVLIPRGEAAILVVATSLSSWSVTVATPGAPADRAHRLLSPHADHASPEPHVTETREGATLVRARDLAHTATAPVIFWFVNWDPAPRPEEPSLNEYSWKIKWSGGSGSHGKPLVQMHDYWNPDKPSVRFTLAQAGPAVFVEYERTERYTGILPHDSGGVAFLTIPYLPLDRIEAP